MCVKKPITNVSCALNVTKIFVRVHMRHTRPQFVNARRNLCQIQHTTEIFINVDVALGFVGGVLCSLRSKNLCAQDLVAKD
jgi:hypothetical protein